VDCGCRSIIALSEDSMVGYSTCVNSETFSDLKLSFMSHCSFHSREFYLHKCILLARCPSLLVLSENGALSHFLRLAIYNENLDSVSDMANDRLTNKELNIDCATPKDFTWEERECVDILYFGFMQYVNYLYTDSFLPESEIKMEPRHISFALRKIVELFFFLDGELFTKKTDLTEEDTQIKIDVPHLSEQFTNWMNNPKKLDALLEKETKRNRQSRALYLIGEKQSHKSVKKARLPSHMRSIFGRRGTFDDCHLSLKSKEGEIHILPAHKVIISQADFFRSLFLSSMLETTSGVQGKTFLDFEKNTDTDDFLFKTENMIPMIHFFYSGSYKQSETLWMDKFATAVNETNGCECMVVANYFDCRSFKTRCEILLSNFLSEEVIVDLLNICDTHEAFFLRERCFNYCVDHFESIYVQKRFHEDLQEDLRLMVVKLARKQGKKVISDEQLKTILNSGGIPQNTQPVTQPVLSTQPTMTSPSSSSSSRPSTTRKGGLLNFLSTLFSKKR